MSFTDRRTGELPGLPGRSLDGGGGGSGGTSGGSGASGGGAGGGGEDTRERLIEAAGEVFAEVGFREAKIRDICARAGANLAAVNYHFRDKESLYLAVFERARECSIQMERSVVERMGALPTSVPPELVPQVRLLAYVRAFLQKLFAEGKPGWHTKLMSREMVDPTAALDMIVGRAIQPNFAMCVSIVRSFLGPGATERQVAMGAASVVGQCLHYHNCRAVTNRLYPGWIEEQDFLEATSRHIWRFSVCALRGMAAEPQWWATESESARESHARMRSAGYDLGDGGGLSEDGIGGVR